MKWDWRDTVATIAIVVLVGLGLLVALFGL